jgi:hypothetical protein
MERDSIFTTKAVNRCQGQRSPIPLQRSKHFPEWALLAREPGGVREFAEWLRENGRAPGRLSYEALTGTRHSLCW